jgi:catechol 2,3-dioxygenase-like lactoylglutathione lyase family enzyme
MNKMIFVNLPVRDLAASTAFYVALGGEVNPQFSDEQTTSVMFSDAIGVMLLTHERYQPFHAAPDRRSAPREPGAADPQRRQPRCGGCDPSAGHGGRRSCRSQSGSGSRLHVQPQRRRSQRQRLGNRLDGRPSARLALRVRRLAFKRRRAQSGHR